MNAETRVIPQAEVELVTPKQHGGCYHWQVKSCPHCGEKHLHGAGIDPLEVSGFLGHRCSHCLKMTDTARAGYDLVWNEVKP